MRLATETTVILNETSANIVGHMNYAASKLWNAAIYERRNYLLYGLLQMPNYYVQAQSQKDSVWYRSLASQSAQAVLESVDEAYKSYFSNLAGGKTANPRPPRYSQANMPITYKQGNIRHDGGSRIRLTIPKALKQHMRDTYSIHEDYLWLENGIFDGMEGIKEITLYPPDKGECRVIVVREVADVPLLADNGHWLGIDPGLHNLLTCFDSNGGSFIAGRRYLSLRTACWKEVARVQKQWYREQEAQGIKHPKKTSKHIRGLYAKMNRRVTDYLHKVLTAVVTYCVENEINTVVIGDLKGIRQNNDKGAVQNQKMHSLPYNRIYQMLEYKLAKHGIRLAKQEESYTSQCSPLAPDVSKKYAKPSQRTCRGLYKDGRQIWNADAVGAFNILRKWLKKEHPEHVLAPQLIGTPTVLKVAV